MRYDRGRKPYVRGHHACITLFRPIRRLPRQRRPEPRPRHPRRQGPQRRQRHPPRPARHLGHRPARARPRAGRPPRRPDRPPRPGRRRRAPLGRRDRLRALAAAAPPGRHAEAIAYAQSGTDEPEAQPRANPSARACPRSARSPATAPGSSATSASRRKALRPPGSPARACRPTPATPTRPGCAGWPTGSRRAWPTVRPPTTRANPKRSRGRNPSGTLARTKRSLREGRLGPFPAAQPPRAPPARGAGSKVARGRRCARVVGRLSAWS